MSVAVLLENFVAASRRMEEEEAAEKAAVRKMMSQFKNPMEPLLAKLASSFVDDADLKEKLNTVYNVRCELPSHPRFLTPSHINMLFPLSPSALLLIFLCFNSAEMLQSQNLFRSPRSLLTSHSYDRAALNILSLRRGAEQSHGRPACFQCSDGSPTRSPPRLHRLRSSCSDFLPSAIDHDAAPAGARPSRRRWTPTSRAA